MQITSDAALAQSNQVAEDVIHQLGLNQTVASFLTSYSVTQVADEVLSITASAPTSAGAAAAGRRGGGRLPEGQGPVRPGSGSSRR